MGLDLRLAVHPAHRREVIATRLVDELESRFRQLDCPRVNLLVMPDNAAGLEFWQVLGYLPHAGRAVLQADTDRQDVTSSRRPTDL